MVKSQYVKKDCPYCSGIHTIIKMTKSRYKCPSCLNIFIKHNKKELKPFSPSTDGAYNSR